MTAETTVTATMRVNVTLPPTLTPEVAPGAAAAQAGEAEEGTQSAPENEAEAVDKVEGDEEVRETI